MDHPAEPLIEHYRGFDESKRLFVGDGWVEYFRMQSLLRARLGERQRILDVGGAAGVHATWLIEDGHDVEIIDIVPSHIEATTRRGFRASVGDARSLPHSDGSFDVVLLLGPLYHLPILADRMRALGEASRVVRRGGLMAVAAINRLAPALGQMRRGNFGDPRLRDALDRIAHTGGDDTGYGASHFYFHRIDEFEHELHEAGLVNVDVLGVEGPAWNLVGFDADRDDPAIAAALEIAAWADSQPAIAAASGHLLAFARTAGS